MSEFIVLIPARRASSRLADKVLADIVGKPMVVRVAEKAAGSGALRVVVATDDDEIKAVVESHGFTALMTRADHTSGTDRLAEAAVQLNLADDDIIVNVQGDEPLISPALIGAVAAELARRPDCAIATACHPLTEAAEMFNPNIVKVALDKQNISIFFTRDDSLGARCVFCQHRRRRGARHESARTADLPPHGYLRLSGRFSQAVSGARTGAN